MRLSAIPVAIVACALASAVAHAQPAITRPVTDEAGVLSPAAIAEIEASLRAHREAGNAQIAVLVVRTLGGIPITDYAMAAATAWGGGSRSDDGVLFVLAIDDRDMRIEVGYGLEDRVPDRIAMRILDEIVPMLRDGLYDGAVRHVVEALIARTAGPPTTPPEEARAALEEGDPRDDGGSTAKLLLVILVLAALVALVLWLFARSDHASASYETEGTWAGARRAWSAPWPSSPAPGPSKPSRTGFSRPKPASSFGSMFGGSHKPSSSSGGLFGGGSSHHKPHGSFGGASHKPSWSGGGGKFGGGGASKKW